MRITLANFAEALQNTRFLRDEKARNLAFDRSDLQVAITRGEETIAFCPAAAIGYYTNGAELRDATISCARAIGRYEDVDGERYPLCILELGDSDFSVATDDNEPVILQAQGENHDSLERFVVWGEMVGGNRRHGIPGTFRVSVYIDTWHDDRAERAERDRLLREEEARRNRERAEAQAHIDAWYYMRDVGTPYGGPRECRYSHFHRGFI